LQREPVEIAPFPAQQGCHAELGKEQGVLLLNAVFDPSSQVNAGGACGRGWEVFTRR